MEKTALKNVIITGATGSIGKAACKAMAERGYHVIMACRNTAKGAGAMKEIADAVPGASLEIAGLSLDSFASIRRFADSLEGRKIDALFNNAGVISREYSLTGDGFEQTVAVNYLGPYLLSRLILPRLDENGQIVNMVSVTCDVAGLDGEFLRKGKEDFHQLRTYASSKLALMLFSIELASRCGVRVNVADPGVVNSNMISMGRWFDPLADIFFRPFCKSPEKGAVPAVNALCSKDSLRLFSGNGSRDIPEKYLSRKDEAARLWEATGNMDNLRHFL